MRPISVALLVLALTACGSAPGSPSTGSLGSADQAAATSTGAAANARSTWGGGLTPTRHEECSVWPAYIVEYLVTGETHGRATLDQVYAKTRANILSQPEGSRLGLARQEADTYISNCDDQVDRQQAQASAAAQAAAQKASDDAATAAYTARCTRYGGYVWHIFSFSCHIDYPGIAAAEIPLAATGGGLDPAKVAENKATCASAASDAKQDAASGLPWADPPQFHPETGVCDEGAR